jgi:hypothetical protein
MVLHWVAHGFAIILKYIIGLLDKNVDLIQI